MTVTSKRPARRGGQDRQPPDGALLRVAVHDDALVGLPPAPRGRDVSVSFSSAAAAAAAATGLEALGYRTVGVSAARRGEPPTADFLVPQTVIEGHPHWWRSLAQRADQTFSLAAGPVHAAFSKVLRTHREPLR